MAIRKRQKKTSKTGYSYQVYFDYTNRYGEKKTYVKGGFERKKDAEAHEVLMRAELINEGLIFKSSLITIDEAFKQYIRLARIKKSTRQMVESKYKLYIGPLFGNYKVNSIDNILVQDKFDELTHLSYGSKDITLRILNNILKFSYENGYIKNKVRIKINLGEKKQREITPVNEQDLLDYMEYIKTSKNSVYKDEYIMALWIGYYTGMRIGEVFALNVNDIDFDKNIIHITKTLEYDNEKNYLYITETKTTASTAAIPLASQLKVLLLEYLKTHHHDVLISKDGSYIRPANLSGNMVYYSKRHGVHLHFHQLRHAMATRLCENDINPKVAQRILRHQKIETTLGIYTHINTSVVEESLNYIFDEVNLEPVKILSKDDNNDTQN